LLVGETDFVPDNEVLPILGEKDTEVALVLDQVKLVALPEVMVVGLALKVTTGLGVTAFTLTVAVLLVVPPAPVAVIVYVVVLVGETDFVPDNDVLPILGEKDTEVALLLDQVKVEKLPEVIMVGLALKLAVGAGV